MKRFTNTLLATLLTASVALSVAACGDEDCAHNVGTWEVVTQATCEDEGQRKGVCGICLQEISEVIPVDPAGHVYGAWDIDLPTETEVGSAVRTCTVNTAHTQTETLPVLGDNAYKTTITKRPTPTSLGERTYTLKDITDIQFTKEIPNTGLETVRDAVDLGVAEESRALIRRGEGTMGWKYYENSASTPKDLVSNHSYEFGENYTHIEDGADECQRWYFTKLDDEGEEVVYGLTDKNAGGKIINELATNSGNEGYLKGSRFYFLYPMMGPYFGLESFLEGLYRSARWSTNGDFEETVKKEGEKTIFAFKYGSTNNSGSSSGYFTKFNVEFTLTDSYAVESLTAQAIMYVNNTEQVDEDGNPLPDIRTWMYDENGHAYVMAGKENGTRYHSTISFTQTEKSNLESAPVNEHVPENMYVQDFDIAYYDEILGRNQEVSFASNISTQDVFQIVNIQPSTALEKYAFDRFTFYLRKTENGQTVDVPINFDTIDTALVAANIQKDYTFSLNAKLSGKQQIVIKTETGIERVIHCNISSRTPTALFPKVWQYTEGAYAWQTAGTEEAVKRIYVGQPLYFTAAVPAGEKNYASNVHTYEAKERTTNEGVPATCFNETFMGGEPVTQFIPTKAGSYLITLTSKMSEEKTCTIRVEVDEAPTFVELAVKEYAEALGFAQTTVRVAFSDVQEVKEEDLLVGYTATATVTIDDGVEVLSCEYVIADKQLTTTHKEGPNFNFKLGMNEVYDFIVSRYYPEFNENEEVVLKVAPTE